VTMALCRTVEDLCADDQTCHGFKQCCVKQGNARAIQLDPSQKEKIDSLLRHYMAFYDVDIKYSFQLVREDKNLLASADKSTLYRKLDEAHAPPGLVLMLELPGRTAFILSKMGPMFITSIALILTIILLFWMTVRSLLRQKQLLERTTDFINNMAHEFKTPMASISLASSMIVKESVQEKPEKLKHYADIIRDENEKLRQQVERLLNIARLDNGDMEIEKKEVDMHEVIAGAVKAMSLQVQERNGQLECSLDAGRAIIKGDALHLANTVINLLDNANKYSKDVPRIAVSTCNKGNTLVVKVADKGIGISSERHNSIFEKFYRVPTGDVHDVKGFGLGLAYVRKIVEEHGGTVSLESEEGKGTTFTMTFPIV
jgi:two-component system, OmpR family, phosphate regulon sensor histidine kinase PhoR